MNCISAHGGSTNPLYSEMNSGGYFMEWNCVTLDQVRQALHAAADYPHYYDQE